MEALREANRPEDAQPRRDRAEGAEGSPRRGNHGDRPGGGFDRGPRGPHRMFAPIHSPVAFLLFDPAAPLPNFPPDEAETGTLKAFPNPASARTTLRYELPEASLVKIELLDPQGNVLKSNPPLKQSAGVQSTILSLEGLQPGVYLIRLMSKQGSQTEKIVVE